MEILKRIFKLWCEEWDYIPEEMFFKSKFVDGDFFS